MVAIAAPSTVSPASHVATIMLKPSVRLSATSATDYAKSEALSRYLTGRARKPRGLPSGICVRYCYQVLLFSRCRLVRARLPFGTALSVQRHPISDFRLLPSTDVSETVVQVGSGGTVATSCERPVVAAAMPPFFQPTEAVVRPMGMFGPSTMAMAPASRHRGRPARILSDLLGYVRCWEKIGSR